MNKCANDVIMENHDYLLELIKAFDLDLSEVYGELAVALCEMANSMDLDDSGVDRKIRSNLSQLCSRLSDKEQIKQAEVISFASITPVLKNPEDIIGNIFMEEIVKELPEENQFIINQLMSGYPLASIASEIGRSITYVTSRIKDSRIIIRRRYRETPMTVREWHKLVGRY